MLTFLRLYFNESQFGSLNLQRILTVPLKGTPKNLSKDYYSVLGGKNELLLSWQAGHLCLCVFMVLGGYGL